MAYGGLRGAVGFSLAEILEKDKWYREMFLTTALAMVFFTCFLQGSTIKFLVKLFDISLKDEDDGEDVKLYTEVQSTMMNMMMSGMESVLGKVGRHRIVGKLSNFEKHYISGYLVTKSVANDATFINRNIREGDSKDILDEHFINLFGPRIIAEEKVNELATKNEMSENVVMTRGNDTQRRDWRKAVAKSQWSDIKNCVDNKLELRRNNTISMSDTILKDKRFMRSSLTTVPEIMEDSSHKPKQISIIGSHYLEDVDEVKTNDPGNNLIMKRQTPTSKFSSKMPSLRSSMIFEEYERLKD